MSAGRETYRPPLTLGASETWREALIARARHLGLDEKPMLVAYERLRFWGLDDMHSAMNIAWVYWLYDEEDDFYPSKRRR